MYLILLGPPGTGKGTQAKLLAERFGLAHVATGDMFRSAVREGTELGRQAKLYMDRGDLVPDELTIAMLVERIGRPDAAKGVVLDGYPRTLQQAQALSKALEGAGKVEDAALLIDASDEEIVSRLSQRWLCGNCGEIYHEEHRPPKEAGICDACGGELSQRADDRPEVVQNRLAAQRPPAELLAYYRARGKLAEVDGEQEMAAVTADLVAAIEAATVAQGA